MAAKIERLLPEIGSCGQAIRPANVRARMNPEPPTAASRLCSACGLCCNGVMFHTVRMQPGDSPKELAALGLRLKRKKRQQIILQPCPAWQNSQCSIYAHRPQRCRLFECRQLKRVASAEISEAAALEKIRDVQRRVEHLNSLLRRAGGTNEKKPLSKRCEKAMSEPIDATSDPATVELRAALTGAMAELDAILDGDFRIAPGCEPDEHDAPDAGRAAMGHGRAENRDLGTGR